MEKGNPKAAGIKRPAEAPRKMWRPTSLVRSEKTISCPWCGEAVEPRYVICPHCGRSLTPDSCSFCGADMKPKARFCTSCGQPREGVECPKCGTVNSRNFCRNCNTPLTPHAQKAIEAAKSDPAFLALQKKADELAELHERIEQMRNAPQNPAELSDEDKALLDEYAAVLGSLGAMRPQPQTPSPTESAREARNETFRTRPSYDDTSMDMDAIMRAYREKADEMNAALAAMTPPSDFTPEQQRDYFSARKVLHKETHYDLSGYEPSLWRCNYCGCLHNCPAECAEPQLGGTWIYQTPEEYIARNPGATYTTLRLD